jgi:hypothetical protein
VSSLLSLLLKSMSWSRKNQPSVTVRSDVFATVGLFAEKLGQLSVLQKTKVFVDFASSKIVFVDKIVSI